MSTILIVLVVLMLLGVFPAWPHSRGWGYGAERRARPGPLDRADPAADRSTLKAESALRGQSNPETFVVKRRRTGGCDSGGSDIRRVQFLARPAAAQTLVLHAMVLASVSGVAQQPGPELQAVHQADRFRVRHDHHRGWLIAVGTAGHPGRIGGSARSSCTILHISAPASARVTCAISNMKPALGPLRPGDDSAAGTAEAVPYTVRRARLERRWSVIFLRTALSFS
jgi:hypothetical protein